MKRNIAVILIILTATGCTSIARIDDRSSVLTHLGAIEEGAQTDGSVVVCEKVADWDNNVAMTREVLRTKALKELARQVTNPNNEPVDLFGDKFVYSHGEQWIAIKATTTFTRTSSSW